jgi:hypothetical protein
MSLTLRMCPLIAAEEGQLKGWNHALVGFPFRHRFARRDCLDLLSFLISEAHILK